MIKFSTFVDGSNLFGALKSMNLEVTDYESLYRYIYKESVAAYNESTVISPQVSCQLQRIYWYVVGSIDEWDLSLPQSQDALNKSFQKDRDTHDYWMGKLGKEYPGAKDLEEKAWTACFNDFKKWYEIKQGTLDGMKRFYQGVRSATDLIDIIEGGHWKVNFLRKYVEEKGLDTSLAVDLVALEKNYDVAIVVSGDADAIPSLRHAKDAGKHVLAVEFISGSPPEQKGRSFSSRLKEHADIVIRIYETELLRLKIGARPLTAVKQ